MADNVTANPGTGGAVFATDDIGGVHYPRQKVAFGPDGQAVDVSGENPFPVSPDEASMATVVLLLSMILEKLPRVDANDRLMTNPSEVAPATTPVSGTLTSVGSVNGVVDITRINGFGTTTARPADAIPMHLSNAGAQHLYDRIVVA